MYRTSVKVLLDRSLAVVILLITSPVSAVIAILIKLESKGPVLFTQTRTGLNGKKFKLYKFRSMTCSNDVRDLSKKNEATKIGKVLRTLSLDEIPQLINVLRGEMSFVGPRPWIPEYYEHMSSTQRRRNNTLPGITGLAQAQGRNSLTIHEKISYDLAYIKDVSFKQDLKILLLTVKTVFDKSAQEIDKSSIHGELDTLRMQTEIDNKALGNEQYS